MASDGEGEEAPAAEKQPQRKRYKSATAPYSADVVVMATGPGSMLTLAGQKGASVMGGEVIEDPKMLKMSELVHRDSMQTLAGAYSKPWAPSSTKSRAMEVVVSPVIFRVNQYAAIELEQHLNHNMIFNGIEDKLWESICPAGMDVTFIDGEETRKPLEWFAEKVINKYWVPEAKELMRSMHLYGFAVVTYGPIPALGGEIAPHVLRPSEYVLEFRIDQNGNRYYTPRPSGALLPMSGEDSAGHPLFKAAEVFFSSEPDEWGNIRSKAAQVLEQLLHADQIMTTHRLILHERSNAPLVIQSRDTAEKRGQGASGDPRVQTHGVRSTMQYEDVPRQTLTRSVQMRAFANNYDHASSSKLQQEMVNESVGAAAVAARLTRMNAVNPVSGLIVPVTPEQTWVRSMIPLPINAELANYQTPELPKDAIDMVRVLISECCVMFGVPPEWMLGALGGGARIAAAQISQENLASCVRTTREKLCRVWDDVYWRIYGIQHIRHKAEQVAEQEERVLGLDEAADAIRNMSVQFSFRSHGLSYERAKMMFDDGVLTGSELVRTAVKEYGLSPVALLVPLSPSERERLRILETQMQQQQTKYSAPGEPSKKSTPEPEEKKKLGDIGVDDIDKAGFVGTAKKDARPSDSTLI